MATHYNSGQFEDAFVPRNLRNWNLPRVTKQYPTAREGYTQFIADDKGHLLPTVPRSKDSPWGTYLGTWDMPLKIPPAKVHLTSRSVAAAARITEWIQKSTALTTACNGLCPEITGTPNDPKEAPIKRSPKHQVSASPMPAQEEIQLRGATTPQGPLSRQPGCIDIRMKDGSLPDDQVSQPLDTKELNVRCTSEAPLSRQPGSMDVRLKEGATPKIPVLSRPGSRESAPRRTISAETPPSSRPRSLECKTKGVNTPELLNSHRLGSMAANPRNSQTPESLTSNRPNTKGSQASGGQKSLAEMDVDRCESPEQVQHEGMTRASARPE